MKSFSSQTVGSDQLNALRTELLNEVNKLRQDVVKAHFWVYVSVGAGVVLAGVLAFLVAHH